MIMVLLSCIPFNPNSNQQSVEDTAFSGDTGAPTPETSLTQPGRDLEQLNPNEPGPGEEICDGVDNDNDGLVDEGFDLDDDGFTTCQNDCDDLDPTVNPGAEEKCDDCKDNNCDGSASECDLIGWESLQTAADATYVGSESLNRVGAALAKAGDYNGDCYSDLFISDPEGVRAPISDGLTYYSGGVYLVSGSVRGDVAIENTATGVLTLPPATNYSYLGWMAQQVASGDIDGDGIYDLAVDGSPVSWSPGDRSLYISYGPLSGTQHPDVEIREPHKGGFVDDLNMAGDVNSDGKLDIIANMLHSSSDAASTSVAFVFFGPSYTYDSTTDANAAFYLDRPNAIGPVSGVGDYDGDGVDDIAIVRQHASTHDDSHASVLLFFGPVMGDYSATEDYSSKLSTSTSYESINGPLVPVDDFTYDGLSDFAVVTEDALYVLPGGTISGSAFSVASLVVLPSDLEGVFSSVDSAGDFNGDGKIDLIIGNQSNAVAGDDAGAAYLFYGPASGTYISSEADMTWFGEGEGTQAGRAVLGAGDVNCDCVDDVVIGAPVPVGSGTVPTEVDAAHLIFGRGF